MFYCTLEKFTSDSLEISTKYLKSKISSLTREDFRLWQNSRCFEYTKRINPGSEKIIAASAISIRTREQVENAENKAWYKIIREHFRPIKLKRTHALRRHTRTESLQANLLTKTATFQTKIFWILFIINQFFQNIYFENIIYPNIK